MSLQVEKLEKNMAKLTIEQILYIIEHYPKRFLCIRHPYQVAQTKK